MFETSFRRNLASKGQAANPHVEVCGTARLDAAVNVEILLQIYVPYLGLKVGGLFSTAVPP